MDDEQTNRQLSTNVLINVPKMKGVEMYRATRELIKARQPHTDYVLEVVSVKKLGGGEANQCFQNATDDEILSQGNQVVSGWIVNPFDSFRNSTAIVQHWWNIDKAGNYFDTTPINDVQQDYVVDSDIGIFGQANFDKLSNLVALSLLLKENKFYGVDEKLSLQSLPSLATTNLFDLPKK